MTSDPLGQLKTDPNTASRERRWQGLAVSEGVVVGRVLRIHRGWIIISHDHRHGIGGVHKGTIRCPQKNAVRLVDCRASRTGIKAVGQCVGREIGVRG